ncbi:MAG TPA: glycoside hydrolase family 28 protein, partial [Sediminibacterium sp.]|nr:glycoside hydrolase family 28 protein [Sediminibacterium sp.]
MNWSNIYKALLCFFFLSCTWLQGSGQQVFDIRKYGAVGDGHADDARAIQAAIDACNAAGGGRVWIPAGHTFLCGPIHLRSHIELYVDANAILLASPDPDQYPESAFGKNTGEGTIWIGGRELEQVTIDGSGTIDGNGIAFMGPEREDSYELKPFHIKDPRPHTLTMIGCRDLRIYNLTIRNSAYWTIHLAGCQDVVVSGITLQNSLKVRNSDGIDLDHSKNIRISDCTIESGDDGICFKNRREYQQYGACENILVTNCTLTSRSCAIKIGSENMDTIRHVLVTNCNIVQSNRGIGIQNRDEGVVSDISFSHLQIETRFFSDVLWGKAEPIYVTAYKRASISGKDASWRFPANQTTGRVGRVTGIYFDDIVCHSENG